MLIKIIIILILIMYEGKVLKMQESIYWVTSFTTFEAYQKKIKMVNIDKQASDFEFPET